MSEDSTRFRKAIEEKCQRIRTNLYQIAKTDNKVTEDELNIVGSVLDILEELQEQVVSVIDDDIITKDEKKTLSKLTAKVVTGSHDMAFSDDILTPDESALLETVRSEIVELQELVYQLQTPSE